MVLTVCYELIRHLITRSVFLAGSRALKLSLPRCDLIGVDVELLRKLRPPSDRP